MTGADIARAMDALGAQYSTGAGFSTSFADVVALKNVFPQAMQLAAKTVIAPSFPGDRIHSSEEPGAGGVSAESRARRWPGGGCVHSRGVRQHRAVLASGQRHSGHDWCADARRCSQLAPDDVRAVGGDTAAGRRHHSRRGALAGAAGVREMDGHARGVASGRRIQARTSSGTRVILLDRPGSVQSSIVIGQPGFRATDPDYLTMVALNHVLGGGFSSRMNMNLREKHGYTYGAFSGLDLRPGAGAFRANSEVRTNATDSALVEAIGEYRRIASDAVPASELQGMVNNLVSGFPNSVQSVQGLSASLQNLIVWGLPMDFYTTYRERLAAVTPDDVKRVAASRLTPDNVIVVVAGDLSKIEAPIRARNLGTVEVWDQWRRRLGKGRRPE